MKPFVHRRGNLSAVKSAWSNQSWWGIWWVPDCGEEFLWDYPGIPQQDQNHTGGKAIWIFLQHMIWLACNNVFFFRWRSWWIDCCTISTNWRRRAYCSVPHIQRLNGLSTTAQVRQAWKRYAFMDSTEASVERMVSFSIPPSCFMIFFLYHHQCVNH